jgi:hypothetical protein
MCYMREIVVPVADDRLDTQWAAAEAGDGRKVVFVRESNLDILDHYCTLGPGSCPIWTAFSTPVVA